MPTTMMFSQWISTSTTAALFAVLIYGTTTRLTVDCFTTSSPTLRVHALSSQPFDRSLIIADSTRQTNVENAVSASFNANVFRHKATGIIAATIATIAIVTLTPLDARADGQTKDFKFPPIDFADVNRCVLKGGSSMGQANAARDKLYDLRQCKLSGADAMGYDLSGVIMKGTDLSKANLKEAQFSKGFLQASNFDGADFSNAIVDRANFQGSSLRGTIFNNAVLTGTSFDDADLENSDFTEAAIGIYDVRNLCKNPTLKGENPVTGADTRLSVGCQ